MRLPRSRGFRWSAAVTVPLVTVAALVATSASAYAAPDFAPASEADIRPGVRTFTGEQGGLLSSGAQCTSNFIFTDGSNVYLGQAAHCGSTSGATQVNGCQTESMPLGTKVEIEGADHPGTLAYSSWITMKRVGETDPDACMYNDFALVKIDPRDVDEVNPTFQLFGGPTGLDTNGTEQGDTVYSYGNSQLTLGLDPLQRKQGVSLGTRGDGWSHTVLTVPPGVPGDSGAGFLNADGEAFGILSTLNVLPQVGSNGVTDLQHALNYMQEHAPGFADVRLVEGTEPFEADGSLLGSLLGLGSLLD